MAEGESLDRLLEPSLKRDASFEPLYSLRAGFFVAFFGGPFAALGFAALNSRRARRLAADLLPFVVFALIAAACVVWTADLAASPAPPEWFSALGGKRRAPRTVVTGVAILEFGLIALRHRPLYAANELRGDKPPSAWVPGLAAVLLGQAVSLSLALLGGTFG
jgi:hypothetical protein